VVWIFFSALIGIGFWKITAQQKILYSPFTLLFILVIFLFIVPILYPLFYQTSPDSELLVDQRYTRLLGLIAGLGLFISLQQMKFSTLHRQRLLLLIVLAGFLQACYGLMEDYLLPADNIFGYDVGYGRPYGIFQQPNVLASFMASTLIISGYLLQKISDKKLQLFLLLTITLNIWVITVAISRTGYLGVLIAFLFLMLWAWKRSKKRVALFLLAILIGIGLGSVKGDALGARNIEIMKEGGARLGHYANSWQMIKQKPLMGYGYGSFEKAYLIKSVLKRGNYHLKLRTSPILITTRYFGQWKGALFRLLRC